jgi:hypothetical protein
VTSPNNSGGMAGGGTAGGGAPRFAEGDRYEGKDPKLLALAIEAAFDYRGDVTLIFSGGEAIKGYLSNRNQSAPQPYVEIFPSDGSERRRIPYAAIQGVAFTGRDTAEGKSWETWLKKYQAKKETEARGGRSSTIGLFPEELE